MPYLINTIKMKLVDVKSNTCIDSSTEVNDKNPKFKTGDNVRISKYEKGLQKVTPQVRQKKSLWLKKWKKLFIGHMLLVTL